MRSLAAMDAPVATPAIRASTRMHGHPALFGSLGALFLACVAATAVMCRSMPGGMTMPGGWTMSMTWMRMPGQSWLAAAGVFLGMWTVMMVAMMTLSLMPVLSRVCKSGSRSDGAARAARVALAGAGYFSVWVILGALIYPLGAGLAMGAMRSAGFANAIPAWAGAAILLADLVPLSAWKCCKLAHCRNAARSIDLPLKAPGMWKIGARLGIECVSCCLPFMTVLLVAGVMNLGIMAAVATGITVERLLPVPEIVARASGVLMVLAGGLLAGGVLTL